MTQASLEYKVFCLSSAPGPPTLHFLVFLSEILSPFMKHFNFRPQGTSVFRNLPSAPGLPTALSFLLPSNPSLPFVFEWFSFTGSFLWAGSHEGVKHKRPHGIQGYLVHGTL